VQHPKAVGDRTTLAAMLALYQAGYAVLMPFGENTRYDLVIDDGNPDTGGVYLVPIEDLPVRRQAALRVDPTRNGRRCRIRSASDYEIGRVPVPPTAREPAPPELRRETAESRALLFEGHRFHLDVIA
jgi:PD-(D/E)XK nuclease superfamily protein